MCFPCGARTNPTASEVASALREPVMLHALERLVATVRANGNKKDQAKPTEVDQNPWMLPKQGIIAFLKNELPSIETIVDGKFLNNGQAMTVNLTLEQMPKEVRLDMKSNIEQLRENWRMYKSNAPMLYNNLTTLPRTQKNTGSNFNHICQPVRPVSKVPPSLDKVELPSDCTNEQLTVLTGHIMNLIFSAKGSSFLPPVTAPVYGTRKRDEVNPYHIVINDNGDISVESKIGSPKDGDEVSQEATILDFLIRQGLADDYKEMMLNAYFYNKHSHDLLANFQSLPVNININGYVVQKDALTTDMMRAVVLCIADAVGYDLAKILKNHHPIFFTGDMHDSNDEEDEDEGEEDEGEEDEGEEDEDEEDEDEDDNGDGDEVAAVQQTIRNSHLELNVGLPPAQDGSLQAKAREALIRSAAALPGEGESACELDDGRAAAASILGSKRKRAKHQGEHKRPRKEESEEEEDEEDNQEDHDEEEDQDDQEYEEDDDCNDYKEADDCDDTSSGLEDTSSEEDYEEEDDEEEANPLDRMFLGKQISEFFDPENLPQPEDEGWGEEDDDEQSVARIFEAAIAAGLKAKNKDGRSLEDDPDMPEIEDLVIEFTSANRRATGYLAKTRKRGRCYRIIFSAKTFDLLFSGDLDKFKEEVRVTMIHEFCHVLTMGKGDKPHGKTWKAKMVDYGLPPNATYTGCPCGQVDMGSSSASFCPLARA